MTVVHCCREECTHYCGRKESKHKAIGNPVDLSLFGNPFYLDNEINRKKIVKQYEDYFFEMLQKNPLWIDVLRLIPSDAKLGCFCAPRLCHCDIIKTAAELFKRKEHDEI